MRDFLDAILAAIVAESLTDLEFGTVTAEFPLFDQGTFDDLARILRDRGGVVNYVGRLESFYKAKGVEVIPAPTGNSNIYVGAPL